MYSEASGETDYTYDSYYLRFRSYHQIWQPFVLAWEVSACEKTGRVPLWDTCRLGLRGFPATEYLSRESLLGQVEARWKVYKKFGVVAIAGAGVVDQPFSNSNPNVSDKNDLIPSYGVGVRYMVLDSKRINFRVDYARSDNNNSAWYVSVTEAF